jgi:hypothetical protein
LPTGSRPLDTAFGQPVRPLLKKIRKTAKSGQKICDKALKCGAADLAELSQTIRRDQPRFCESKNEPRVSAHLGAIGDRFFDSVEFVMS